MNLQSYRSSFTVFIADSALDRGQTVSSQLGLAGYACQHVTTLESLLKEVPKNPPHIMIFQMNDAHFYSNDERFQDILGKVQYQLPEVQVILLCRHEDLAQGCEWLVKGIYDCVAWPLEHPLQLLRMVDHAAENNYYMYVNEQLQEQLTKGGGSRGDRDFALYNVWLKEVERAISREELLDLLLREVSRYLKADVGIYLTYRAHKKTLVATQAYGLRMMDIEGIGINLGQDEPGFLEDQLQRPHDIRALMDFAANGLQKKHAVFFPCFFTEHVDGVFAFCAREGQTFQEEDNDDGYVHACIRIVQWQIFNLEMSAKFKRLSVYDDESESLNQDIFVRKLSEEVSRARRITRPVSVIMLSIDGLADLLLLQTKENVAKFLKAFCDIVVKNSRLNDLIGRVSFDQFCICLPHTDCRGAMIKAERIRRIISSADFSAIIGAAQKISVCAGVSEYPSMCHDSEDLLKTAEAALNDSRRRGSDRIGVAAPPARFTPDFMVKDGKAVSPHHS